MSARLKRLLIILPFLAVISFPAMAPASEFVIRSFYVASGAMSPTLQTHDVVVVSAYSSQSPKHGDIVLFRPPIPSKNPFIKRIIAVPGDTFSITNGVLSINGSRLNEPYTAEPTNYSFQIHDYDIYIDGSALDPSYASIPPRNSWHSSSSVPRGCFIVLGDNRNNSEDSHIFGFVCPGYRGVTILGKVMAKNVGESIEPLR